MITSIVIILAMTFIRMSQPKCTQITHENVTVRITDEFHRSAYAMSIASYKSTSIRIHPSVYKITVEYNRNKYILNGEDTYNEYKNMVGRGIWLF